MPDSHYDRITSLCKMKKIFILSCLFLVYNPLQSQVNIAVNKSVTVDSEISSQPAWKAVDGLNYSNSNRWVSDDEGYPHWIEVDLGQAYQVSGINFYTGYYGDNHPVHEYRLQSWNGSAWVDMVHVTNNLNPVHKHLFNPGVTTTKIRLDAISGEGDALMLYEIEVFALFNAPPSLDEVTDPEPVYADEGTQTIWLTGISDGDTASVQTINITAESSNTAIVPDPVIQYAQGDSMAALSWSPAGPEGTAVITVTVQDEGGSAYGGSDSRKIQFTVSVRDPGKNYAPTMDEVPDVYAFSTGETYRINLSGISDGDPNKEQDLELSTTNTQTDLLTDVGILFEQGDTTAILFFTTTQENGTAGITVTVKDAGGVSGAGTDSLQISLNIIITSQQDAVQISTDLQEKHQVIEGFGGFGLENVTWSRGPYYSQGYIDDIVDDLGVTILRIATSPQGFEPFNDNEDPYDTDLELYRNNIYAYEDWKSFDFIRDLFKKDPDIKVIMSNWSPPAWMKSNKNVQEGGYLLPSYYEEFAEYIVAYIKLFKQETGGDLYAFSLQNEPTFWEPYESCQYTPRTYCDLIKVVGERFELEGLTTKLFYPEEVMVRTSDMAGWMNTLNNDVYAREYVDIVAVHGYESTGISAGEIGGELWDKYYSDYVNYPGYPKQFWMSETSGQPNNHTGAIRLISGLSNAITYGRLNAWVYWTISGEEADPYDAGNVYNLMLNGEKLKKYYVSKNYYRYVRPGARAVECSSSDIDVLANAFWHEEDNSLTYVLINKSGDDKIVNFDSYEMATDTRLFRTSATENCEAVSIPAGSESFLLPPMSVSTFVLSGGTYNNHPPTIENAKDTILAGSPDSLAVILRGISDGDADKDQELEVTASFDNDDVVSRLSLNVYSGTDSALLIVYLNPGVSGENITTVTLTENDTSNTNNFMPVTRMSFSTWVINYINKPPHFNELDTAYIELSKGQQSIKLTGVTDGNEEVEEHLDIDFWAVHDRYFDFDSLVYEQGDSNLYIWVTPKRLGAAIVRVSITDDGETIFGENFFEDDFFIKVMDSGVSTDDLRDPGVTLFPNPADQHLVLSNVVGYESYAVFNLTGSKLETGLISGDALHLETGNYQAGIYYIRISTSKRSAIHKFMVAH